MVERGDRHRSPTAPTPRVTVVMATYNWAPVLPYSIASVLDQDFADFELLVVGDACTDESAEVVAAIDDPRVQWHDLATNHGHQWAPNNEGMRRARGDMVAYLGHDDIWLPRPPDVPGGRHRRRRRAGSRPPAHGGHRRATEHLAPDRDGATSPEPGSRRPVWPTDATWPRPPGGGAPPPSRATGTPNRISGVAWRSGPTCAWAPTSSAVKLSAATRHHVYRQRPHHEQRYWLELIRAAPDPEAEVRARRRRALPPPPRPGSAPGPRCGTGPAGRPGPAGAGVEVARPSPRSSATSSGGATRASITDRTRRRGGASAVDEPLHALERPPRQVDPQRPRSGPRSARAPSGPSAARR